MTPMTIAVTLRRELVEALAPSLIAEAERAAANEPLTHTRDASYIAGYVAAGLAEQIIEQLPERDRLQLRLTTPRGPSEVISRVCSPMGDFLLALMLAIWTAVAITAARLGVSEMVALVLVSIALWILASQKIRLKGSSAFGPLKKI